MPDQRNALAYIDRERHILKDPIFFLIGEPNALELNASLCLSGELRYFRRRDEDFAIEHYEDPVRCDDRSLKDVELIRKITDRLEELQRILYEGCEHADRQRLGCGRKAAEFLEAEGKYDHRHTDSSDKIDQRIEDGVIVDRFDVRIAIVIVDLGETPSGFLLGVEKLYGLRTRYILLQERVQLRASGTHAVKTMTGALAKPVRSSK